MSTPESPPRPAGPRDIYYFTHPERWPAWPFLPVVRRHAGGATDCGLLYDFRGTGGPTGFSSTVFVGNLFLLPPTLEELLALPKETFDTFEELLAAGWRIDGPDLVVIAVSP